MVQILRIQATWSGMTGAPGYTSLYFRDFGTGDGGGTEPDIAQAQSAAERVGTFFTNIRAHLPGDVSIAVDPSVDMIEDTTGELQDVLNITPPTVLQPDNQIGYSGPVGAVVNWRTQSVKNGRRIRGRTFLVPLNAGCYIASGQLSPAVRDGIQVAADTLADSTNTPDLGVWSRPDPVTGTGGQWAVVASAQVPLLAAVLRSRRD